MSQFHIVDDGSLSIVVECRDCGDRQAFPINMTDIDSLKASCRYAYADAHECRMSLLEEEEVEDDEVTVDDGAAEEDPGH